MSTAIVKPAAKVGCDRGQLLKRGWRIIDDGDVTEPTCSRMLPEKSKHEDEIWVKEKECRKKPTYSARSEEEFERLCQLFAEEPQKLTDEESKFLIGNLPKGKLDQLISIGRDSKIAEDKEKAKAVIPIPFVQEPGGCHMCGKKGHNHATCNYQRFVPVGASVGPRYEVHCASCYQEVSQPVLLCKDFCGLVGGFAVPKFCIFCGRFGHHHSQECESNPEAALKLKLKLNAPNPDL